MISPGRHLRFTTSVSSREMVKQDIRYAMLSGSLTLRWNTSIIGAAVPTQVARIFRQNLGVPHGKSAMMEAVNGSACQKQTMVARQPGDLWAPASSPWSYRQVTTSRPRSIPIQQCSIAYFPLRLGSPSLRSTSRPNAERAYRRCGV
jgi:hypothetical protein